MLKKNNSLWLGDNGAGILETLPGIIHQPAEEDREDMSLGGVCVPDSRGAPRIVLTLVSYWDR